MKASPQSLDPILGEPMEQEWSRKLHFKFPPIGQDSTFRKACQVLIPPQGGSGPLPHKLFRLPWRKGLWVVPPPFSLLCFQPPGSVAVTVGIDLGKFGLIGIICFSRGALLKIMPNMWGILNFSRPVTGMIFLNLSFHILCKNLGYTYLFWASWLLNLIPLSHSSLISSHSPGSCLL